MVVPVVAGPPAHAAAELIERVTLSSPVRFGMLAGAAASLAESERPFGLVVEVDGIDLDHYRDAFPRVRALPGGRARFGAWCRGVAYVFGASTSAVGASIHLEHAPRIWGASVYIAQSDADAAAWLHRQFLCYRNSHG